MSVSETWKMRLNRAMKKYFKSYKKRFPYKSTNEAINATKNWVVGYISKMFGPPSEETLRWIESTLTKLLLEDCD